MKAKQSKTNRAVAVKGCVEVYALSSGFYAVLKDKKEVFKTLQKSHAISRMASVLAAS